MAELFINKRQTIKCNSSPEVIDLTAEIPCVTLQVDHLCRYLLDLSLCDIHFVEHLASRKAAASIYVARRIVLHAEELKDDDSTIAWTRTLQFYRFDMIRKEN